MASKKIRTLTASATMNNTEETIVFNATSAITFTLNAATNTGRHFKLINIGAGSVTITPYDEDTINGATSLVLTTGENGDLDDIADETWIFEFTAALDIERGGTGIKTTNANNTIYVDGSRTDTYTADGSQLRPYKTILAALTVINAAALVKQTASEYDEAQYVLNIAQGEYDDNLTISNVKYLRFNMEGVVISGDITHTTTIVGGTADYYYSRLEFFGATGVRPEKGMPARISGDITGTRNNDSLMYVSFFGVNTTGDISYETNGTWVLHFANCRVEGRLSCSDSAVALVETTGKTEFKGSIAAAEDAETAISLYNVDNCKFDVINIDNANGSRITNCIFNDAVTISGGNVSIDGVSYKSLVGQTETLTGATIVPLDQLLPTAAGIYSTKTVKKTIGGVGVTGCDFNFATAENTTEQPIDLGAIVPALGRVVDIFLHTESEFTGAVTLVADVGPTTGDGSYISSATIFAADAILAVANDSALLAAPDAAATHVWVNATPGANWNLVTAGKVAVYVTYIDVTSI